MSETRIPDPVRATHFYRHSNVEHLEWLKTIVLDHELYLPTVRQLWKA